MRSRLLAPLFLLALIAAGCDGEEPSANGGGDAPAEGTIEIGGVTANDRGSYSVTDFEKVAVEAGSFYFEPTVVTGPPGLQIELDFVTDGEQPNHNVTLEEQQIVEEIPPDSIVGVFVTIPESGSVAFYCEYHRDQGMAGGLTAV